jgi:ubiquinone/menaquinone biosynthesis C-methylase UbiE
MMKQVVAAHYNFAGYVTPARFMSFWHQVHEVARLGARNVLEIGPGPGIVTGILRGQGIAVTTCDIADDTKADVCASVSRLPFADNTFDVVVCCQVLEHLPFGDSIRSLEEIRRVCRVGSVVSLPQAGRYWPFTIHVPFVGALKFGVRPPGRPKPHVFDGQHHWEIGKTGYEERRILEQCERVFSSVRSFRVHENHYHRFFVLRK